MNEIIIKLKETIGELENYQLLSPLLSDDKLDALINNENKLQNILSDLEDIKKWH